MPIYANGTIITTEGNGAYLNTMIQTNQNLTNTAGSAVNNVTLHTPRSLCSYEHSDGTTGSVGVRQDRGLPVVYQRMSETVAQATVGTASGPLGGPLALLEGIHLKALAANTVPIYVKKAASVTTTNGWELRPGDEVFLRADNLTEIAMISASAGQKLCYKAW
jgi:hypothetical protein